jgi:hypothetical protein
MIFHVALEEAEDGRVGWQTMGRVGSYLVMTKAGERANLSIPQHKELSVDEFLELLQGWVCGWMREWLGERSVASDGGWGVGGGAGGGRV